MSAPEIQNETELSLSDSPPPSTEASISIAEPNPPLTNTEKPLVLIVGAGIGGLMLGNLLQKGNIPYLIFEQAKQVKPLGMFNLLLSIVLLPLRVRIYNNRELTLRLNNNN